MTLRDGMGREMGGRVRMGNTYMYTLGWFMWMFGKNHHNIVISFQLKKTNKLIELKKKKNRASLVTQSVKNLPAIQGTWVQSLG